MLAPLSEVGKKKIGHGLQVGWWAGQWRNGSPCFLGLPLLCTVARGERQRGANLGGAGEVGGMAIFRRSAISSAFFLFWENTP